MQVRRGFVHVQMSREYIKVWIPLLKPFHILVKNFLRKLSVFGFRSHVVFITYLKYNLAKRLFLLTCSDFLVVVANHSVLACLFGVIFFKRFIE